MNWSLKIARVFGIDIKVHITFLLILFLGAMQWSRFGGPGMVFGILVVVLLFVCVTLHELGHSVVALHYKIPVKDIVLLPIGGVASLARMPTNPLQELLIAVAGPLVNVVIVGVLWLVMHRIPLIEEMLSAQKIGIGSEPGLATLLLVLFSANIMLVIFNMIPAFPMDGGRVFRATLAFFMPYARATRIAAVVGQGLAVVMGIYGLMNQPILAVIAFFIFMAAGAENAATQAKTVLITKRVGDCYNRTAITLTIDDRVSTVVDHLLTSYQPDFAVVHRGQLQGVVTREDVLKYLEQNSYDVFVTEILEDQFLRVDRHQTLDEVSELMQEKDLRLVAVFEHDQFLGLLSREDIYEAQKVLQFVQRSRERHSAAPAQPATA